MKPSARRNVAAGAALALFLVAAPAAGQSGLDRGPNVADGWTGRSGVLHFHFIHRFNAGAAPARKVTNSPTFLLAASLPARLLAGARYATASDVVSAYPNEWEFFARWAPLAPAESTALGGALTAAYNLAARSVDAEATAARSFGRLRLIAGARAFSNAYDAGKVRGALAAGAAVRITRHIAVLGDAASLLDRRAGERTAWSAGLGLEIPYSPHSFTLYATNATTATLQGASRGRDRTSYGFEFTIPLTLGRYFRGPQATAAAPPAPARTAALSASSRLAAAPFRASIEKLAYTPTRIEVTAGTTVVWRNDDPLPHTVTADDGSWDSRSIEPGATWSYTFDRPGSYPFHCTPHPFMKGVVVVVGPERK